MSDMSEILKVNRISDYIHLWWEGKNSHAKGYLKLPVMLWQCLIDKDFRKQEILHSISFFAQEQWAYERFLFWEDKNTDVSFNKCLQFLTLQTLLALPCTGIDQHRDLQLAYDFFKAQITDMPWHIWDKHVLLHIKRRFYSKLYKDYFFCGFLEKPFGQDKDKQNIIHLKLLCKAQNYQNYQRYGQNDNISISVNQFFNLQRIITRLIYPSEGP